jgi:hypothetical protein
MTAVQWDLNFVFKHRANYYTPLVFLCGVVPEQSAEETDLM